MAKRQTHAPASINRYSAALGAVLTWAIRTRIAPKGWVSPGKSIERRPEHNEIVHFLSDDERNALLAACKASSWSRLYLLVLTALVTGARKDELEGLRWADIDFDGATATLARSKNGDRRVLPLVPAVIEKLRRHVGEPEALIFAIRRRPDVPFNSQSAWRAALETAGVRNFRFHDLRHSCASYLAMNGASLVEIGAVLGHRGTRCY